MSSKERGELLQKSEAMTIGETHVQEAHGFEPWFTLPERSAVLTPPPRYKMALLTILAIYPSLLVLSTLLSYLLPHWPRALLILVNVILLVPAMTYYIMPRMTQLFRTWLYPKAATS
jgi:antibiotic biosynthesis monooxygenase (ABM) superfamily enzyme